MKAQIVLIHKYVEESSGFRRLLLKKFYFSF